MYIYPSQSTSMQRNYRFFVEQDITNNRSKKERITYHTTVYNISLSLSLSLSLIFLLFQLLSIFQQKVDAEKRNFSASTFLFLLSSSSYILRSFFLSFFLAFTQIFWKFCFVFHSTHLPALSTGQHNWCQYLEAIDKQTCRSKRK